MTPLGKSPRDQSAEARKAIRREAARAAIKARDLRRASPGLFFRCQVIWESICGPGSIPLHAEYGPGGTTIEFWLRSRTAARPDSVWESRRVLMAEDLDRAGDRLDAVLGPELAALRDYHRAATRGRSGP